MIRLVFLMVLAALPLFGCAAAVPVSSPPDISNEENEVSISPMERANAVPTATLTPVPEPQPPAMGIDATPEPAPTATPAPPPPPPSAGIHTTADLIGELSRFPQEYVCFLDDQTVVRFAYPSPLLDWAGFAFINHIPSMSSVTLRHPYEIVDKDGNIEKEDGAENLYGHELIVRRHYNSEEGEAKLEAVLASEDLVQRIVSGSEECQGAIPEPTVREAIRMMWLSGPAEAEPGFGGLFRDGDDNSIVYVYMLDTSQQESAEKAAREILGARRFEDIQEVRVLQGQYSMSQLSRWYAQMRDSVSSVKGISMTDLNEGENRIYISMSPRPGARSELEAALESAGVPLEAVHIDVGCPAGDTYQPPGMPEDSIYQSIELWVEAPAEVKAGETVPLILKAKNVGDEPVRLVHGVGHDFVITRPDGSKVWNKLCGNEWDNQGEIVEPGEYLVYGVFDDDDEVPAKPAKVIIAP